MPTLISIGLRVSFLAGIRVRCFSYTNATRPSTNNAAITKQRNRLPDASAIFYLALSTRLVFQACYCYKPALVKRHLLSAKHVTDDDPMLLLLLINLRLVFSKLSQLNKNVEQVSRPLSQTLQPQLLLRV